MPATRKKKPNRICTLPGCGKTEFCKGLCAGHYHAQRRAKKRAADHAAVMAGLDRDFLHALVRQAVPIFERATDQPVWEWTEENIRLPESESFAGSVPDWGLAPEMKFIFEQLKNPDVREITLMFSSQSSKTLFGICAMAWLIDQAKLNGMFCMPTQALYNRMPRQRLRPIYEISSIGLGEDPRDNTQQTMKFNGSQFLTFALASSPAQIAEMPAGFVWADEIDEIKKMDIDPIELMQSRIRTFKARSKFILSSTPKRLLGDGGVLDHYSVSRRHIIEMKCPECGSWQVWDFEQIKWPGKDDKKAKQPDPNELAANSMAWAECKNGCKVTDESHDEMVEGSRWLCLDPEKPETHIGFQKRVYETIHENWSSTARAYLQKKAQGENALKDFHNSWLAMPIDLKARIVDVGETRARLDSYQKGQIPAGCKAITAGVDVGKDDAWLVLLAWAPGGRMYEFWSARIDWEGDKVGKLMNGIAKAVNDSWPYLGIGDPPRFMGGCIDSGYKTDLVYNFCRANHLFKPIKGAVNLSRAWVVNSVTPRRRPGEKVSGNLNLYTLNQPYWQDMLQTALEAEPEAPGGMNLPGNASPRYIQHLNNEVKVTDTDAKGRVREVWRPITGGAPNHLRDATLYAMVAGHLARVHNMIQLPEDAREAEELKKRPEPAQLAGARKQGRTGTSRRDLQKFQQFQSLPSRGRGSGRL